MFAPFDPMTMPKRLPVRIFIDTQEANVFDVTGLSVFAYDDGQVSVTVNHDNGHTAQADLSREAAIALRDALSKTLGEF